MVQGVHVGDGNIEGLVVGGGMCTRLDMDRQCAELLALVGVGLSMVEPGCASEWIDD